jgi:hypothetical protein
MKRISSKFNERLLALNHLFKYSNTVVMSLIKYVGLKLVTNMLVSSANRFCLDLFLTRLDNHLYKEESKGPSTVPCGTPCIILPHFKVI